MGRILREEFKLSYAQGASVIVFILAQCERSQSSARQPIKYGR